MSRIIGILSDEWVRGIIATLLAISIVFGFFIGLVPFEFFKDICLMVLTYFFVKRRDDRVVAKEVEKQIEIKK